MLRRRSRNGTHLGLDQGDWFDPSALAVINPHRDTGPLLTGRPFHLPDGWGRIETHHTIGKFPMREPAQVFHISEFLCEEMAERGWTTADVAARMKTPQGPVRDMLALDLLLCVHDDGLLMGDEQCEGIARAFEVSPDFIRGLDETWRAWPDRRSPFTPPLSVFSPHSTGAI